MAFLRVTQDSRGYQSTYLLHARHPGERPRVLYWYRSAPGVRVGRPPLDEDAIRTIEEQHPDVDFDWPQILEVGSAIAPEIIEQRPPRPRRPKPAPPRQQAPADVPDPASTRDEGAVVAPVKPVEAPVAPAQPPLPPPSSREPDLLRDLVGREIATRLRARYRELRSRLDQLAGEPRQAAWEAQLETINPERWSTPDEILRGITNADATYERLRHQVP